MPEWSCALKVLAWVAVYGSLVFALGVVSAAFAEWMEADR